MPNQINRRNFIHATAAGIGAVSLSQVLAACKPIEAPATTETSVRAEAGPEASTGSPVVYMTTDISSAGVMAIYEALGRAAHGNTAVKLHSGEPGGHHFLTPEFIEPLVSAVNGTIVECNTAYGGRRSATESHLRVMQDHGFTSIANVDIMDADGSMSLPVANGKHLTECMVGKNFDNYDFVVILSHFKGHAMGGFGGSIKNMAIGISSATGKSWIHSAGTATRGLSMGTPQDDFLESMAEGAKAIADYVGENIIYINVMNNLSVDCDCDSHPAEPTMADIGILASLDPVALDKACVDLVYAAPDSADLIQRMESRNGIHTLDYGAEIGLGSLVYELVSI